MTVDSTCFPGYEQTWPHLFLQLINNLLILTPLPDKDINAENISKICLSQNLSTLDKLPVFEILSTSSQNLAEVCEV